MLSVLEKLVSLEAGKLAPLIDLDMSKYIDAEKLKAHIQYIIKKDNYELFDVPELLSFIDSLQQEQPESSKGKFVFPNFLYARTVDNKTIDISYAPQSLDAVEYIKNDPTEQPEVDLEKEIENYFNGWSDDSEYGQAVMHNGACAGVDECKDIARHFYELGLNARNED